VFVIQKMVCITYSRVYYLNIILSQNQTPKTPPEVDELF